MLVPVFRIAKISIGELVGFDDESHDLFCPRDHVSTGKEPQFSDKRVPEMVGELQKQADAALPHDQSIRTYGHCKGEMVASFAACKGTST